jgi:hypothetical protein
LRSWVQSNVNAPTLTSKRLPDGTVPTTADVIADPSLADNITATYSNATAVEEAEAAYANWLNLTSTKLAAAAKNVFTAHKAAVDAGLLQFSESTYAKFVLKTSLNITDELSSLENNYDSWYYESVYFSASDWRTVGLIPSSTIKNFQMLISTSDR